MTDMDDVKEPRGGGLEDAPDQVAERTRASAGGSSAGTAEATATDAATLSAPEDWHRQLDEQRDKYLRLAAEYENFRRRSTRERQEAGWRAQGDLVQGLTETLDDIMRFAHVDPETTDAATVVQGVAMVEKKILKSLAGHGMELVNPIGQPFDPNLHEAVGTEPADTPDEDHLVARVYQVGYVFRGQLLRPARVVVRQWNG